MSGRAKARVIIMAVFVPLLLLTVAGLYLISREAGTGQPGGAGGFTLSLGADEAYPQGLLPQGLLFDRLLLEKKARRLTAYCEGKPVRVYLVSLGFAPEGHKEVEGDGKTPEGEYYIDSKNPKSAYYKNLGISYPNAADRERAAKLGKSPGGDIKIHGLAPAYAALGQAHRLTDWTYGCIAVTNEEMEELYQRTPVGTPILIVP
jgi:hypothetical protein